MRHPGLTDGGHRTQAPYPQTQSCLTPNRPAHIPPHFASGPQVAYAGTHAHHAPAARHAKEQKLMSTQSDPKKLVDSHRNLIHSELLKVISHVQRDDGEWVLHTVMTEGCDVPFKFRRKGKYQNLKGARVNITYYPAQETVAGLEFEIMKVVRIKRG
jgi:hypothetical protein